MITYLKGNLFDSAAQAITNTVNCVGVMGKGVALEFKNRLPEMYEDYQARCKNGAVQPGKPYLWENEKVQVLNFPTKRHWNESARLSDIEAGLKYLADHFDDLGLQSLAMPALGCGNGGLRWEDVRPLIDKYLGALPTFDVYVYEPSASAIEPNPSTGKKSKLDSTSDGMAAQQTLGF